MMKMIFKTIAINFMLFSTLIVGTEILGQFIYLIKNGTLLPLKEETKSFHDDLFELHPYLAGRLKASAELKHQNKTITITKDNRRWTGAGELDSNKIVVALVGGSTTFGTRVSDEDSWSAILQKQLGNGFIVVNYGVPGYSTAENIIQTALLLPEISPDYIVFYEGWNDIKNYHEKKLGADYFAHGISQYDNLRIPLFKKPSKLNYLAELSATFWLIKKVQLKLFVEDKIIKDTLFSTPDSIVDKYYIRNLKTLSLLALGINAEPIFIPQILNEERIMADTSRNKWTKTIINSALPGLMTRMNEKMISLFENRNEVTLLKSVLELDWTKEDFIDEGHFSKIGGVKFSNILYQYFRQRGKDKFE